MTARFRPIREDSRAELEAKTDSLRCPRNKVAWRVYNSDCGVVVVVFRRVRLSVQTGGRGYELLVQGTGEVGRDYRNSYGMFVLGPT